LCRDAALLLQALNEEQKQLLSTKDTVERSVAEHTAILALLEEVAATESAIAVAKAAEEAEAAARVVSHNGRNIIDVDIDSLSLITALTRPVQDLQGDR
jgi:hypothetical protein